LQRPTKAIDHKEGTMIFLPFERFTIKTYLNPEEVQQRLADVVEPKQWIRSPFSKNHLPYQGNINGNRFEISRIIHRRNSFLPVIKGEIKPDLGGSSVEITMHPHFFVIAFMVFWFGSVFLILFGSVGALIAALFQPNGDGMVSVGVLLAPLGFIAFGYLLVNGSFQFEAVKSKRFFQELFEAVNAL